jgi:cell division protein ZapE
LTGPLAEFRRRVAAGQLEADPAQQPVIASLERLHRELVAARRAARSVKGRIGRRLGRPAARVRGLYLHGSVGRGKTLMMDLFFQCLPFAEKRRQHFHRFMAMVHEELRSLRDTENPLDTVADRIAADCRVLCFDELAVTDIADAMLLGTLLTALFERGVTLVATSNIAPGDLYRDGLQRQRFLPAIAAIEANTTVLGIDGERDYRLRLLESASMYVSPADAAAETKLERFFAAVSPDATAAPGTLEVHGRPIDYRRLSDGIVWFDFGSICDGPRSQDDYIEIAREFHTVIVADVPALTRERENQARRLIALVDEFYDRKVNLMLSAEVPLVALYSGSKLAREFERTRSRLTEMQSHDYLAAPHRP